MTDLEKVARMALAALEQWNTPLYKRGVVITALRQALEQPAQQQEPVRLRRGNILRCIETDELCTVWSTSTTGKTLVKWSANDFGAYTAEQIGELFWLEPEPDDLELAAEKSDNYAAFHAGYRFAVAHSLAEQPAQQEPVDWEAVAADQAMTIAMMKAEQEAAVLAEREACAQVCDDRDMGDCNREDMEARACAAAIRERNNP